VKGLKLKEFRVIKSEIRILGVDDGKFVPHTKGEVIVVGVVFGGGSSIDGVMHTHISIDGFDSTQQIASMIIGSPHHKQLRLVMLYGITFGGFNVVNIRELCEATELPVIALTCDQPDMEAVKNAICRLPRSEDRWNIILEAGKIREIISKGKKLYMETAGISEVDAREIIESTATRSCVPEPLRVAHLIASGISL